MASVTYTIASCSLGYLLVAATSRGICAVRLGDTAADLEVAFLRDYPFAVAQNGTETDTEMAAWIATLQRYLEGQPVALDLPLDVSATTFQQRVWDALRAIPYGETRTYGEIAHSLQQPGGSRAVGHACGANPVALIIPCHRAIRADGGAGGYRWGLTRKQALLALEQGQSRSAV
jgi:O-6-methylguanine DNA methyltransferase